MIFTFLTCPVLCNKERDKVKASWTSQLTTCGQVRVQKGLKKEHIDIFIDDLIYVVYFNII